MPEADIIDNRWRGERAFIVGGGQSAHDMLRPSKPLPGRVIAIKDAAFLYPGADIVFYSGKRFHKERPVLWRWIADGPGQIWKRAVEPGVPPYVHQVARQKVKDGVVNGLSLRRDRLGGWCSGGSAINLAFHMGASEIILLGLDFTGAHWNTDHPDRFAYEETHRRHRQSVDAMAEPLKYAGVRIGNLSPVSTLKEWPRVTLESLSGQA